MNVKISPEPTEAERAAILAALAARDDAQDQAAPWAQTQLPQREDELEEP